MKKFLLASIVNFCCVIGFAQNTASPYSIIGLGDIEKSFFDRTTGLGHAGIALTSDRNLLLSNPASLSFLTNPYYSNPFYFDVAARYKNVNYAGDAVKNSTTNQANDLQFKKIAFAIKPKANWGLSFGLLPFSNANYSFTGIKRLQGSNEVMDAIYQGSGSTNLLYLSNSILIAKKLSIGVQTSLMFGQMNTKEILYNYIADSGLITEKNIFLSKVVFKGGFIYRDTINKDWNYSVGATGSLQNSIGATYDATVKNGNVTLNSKKVQQSDYTKLPAMGTVGVCLNYKSNYTFVADYTRQNWSNVGLKGTNYNVTNSSRIGVGLQYTGVGVFRDNRGNTFAYEKYFYQAGFYQQNGYLNIAGTNISEFGITLGAGKQLTNNLSLQANIEIGSRGTTDKGLIKENISQVGVTISYRDFWNTKKIKRYN